MKAQTLWTRLFKTSPNLVFELDIVNLTIYLKY